MKQSKCAARVYAHGYRWVFWASVFLTLLVLAPSDSFGQTQTVKKQDVVDTFKKNMTVSDATATQPIRKWAKEIRFSILGDGAAAPQLIETAAHAFSEIEKVTPLKFYYASDKTNFVVIFVKDVNSEIENYKEVLKAALPSEAAFKQFIEGAKKNPKNYLTLRANNEKSEIAFFCLFISTERHQIEEDLSPENYLVRGIFAGLGLGPGSVDTASIFNTELNSSKLLPIDRVMLKAFYSPTINPGMPLGAAELAFEQAVQ